MAHKAQRDFFSKVRQKYPDFFISKKVLECGSLNINGSFRDMFKLCDYTGIDIVAGQDVDIISKIHEIEFKDNTFDIVVTGEMLEHDEYWKLSLQKMYDVLKPKGLLVITCGGKDRPEHGTRKTGGFWGTSIDYYKNITPNDIQEIYKEEMFITTNYEENETAKDTYFYGIKR